jgi:hypothetical protein
MNIEDIFSYQENEKHRKYKIYDKLLDKIKNKINTAIKYNVNFIYFRVIRNFDDPPFDVKPCILYLMLKLKKLKYFVLFLEPNIIFISWEKELKNIKEKRKMIKGKENNK